jgi:hypothetical protein
LHIPAFLAALALASPAVGPAASWSSARDQDAVVVPGRALSATGHAAIPDLALLASTGGRVGAIPFQVDERTLEGNWVLDQRSPYLSDDERDDNRLTVDDSPGAVDDTDELVFMASDAGDRLGAEDLPAGVVAADELEVTDPVTGGRGWAYLVTMPSGPWRSNVDYVALGTPAEGDELVTTPVYRMGYSRQAPMTPSLLTVGDDTNLVDRFKVRIQVRLLRLFPLVRDEEDLRSRLWQYKDGPVRVIRELRSSMRLVARIQSPALGNQSINYRESAVFPFQVTLPFPAAAVTDDATITGWMDGKDLHGWRVRTNSDPRTLLVDGVMDATEKSLVRDGALWAVCLGPGVDMAASFRAFTDVPLTTRFTYLDDQDAPRPPERFRGEVPGLGFEIRGVEKLPRGPFHFRVAVGIHRGARSDQAAMAAAALLDTPLGVEVRPLRVPEAPRPPP